MKRRSWPGPVMLWAIRDVRRHPVQAGMLLCTLTGLSTLLSVALLLNQTFTVACDQLMAQTPAITIRRTGPGGWLPMPVEACLARVRPIPGALNPRVRVWGVVRSPQGPVTVVGDLAGDHPGLPGGLPHPRCGQAVIGPGLQRLDRGARLRLSGQVDLDLAVKARMPARSAMATHDLVVVHPADARALLGLSAQQASDVVLDVFHEQESQALLNDLARALPWPVNMTTRAENIRRCKADVTKRSLPVLLAFGPALAALATLVLAVGIWGHRQRFYLGLLKAMGWGNADILSLQLQRAVLIGLPALLCGLGCAYLLLFWPGATLVSRLFLSWPGLPAPALYLPAVNIAGPMGLVILLIGLPYVTASLYAGWQAVKADPAELLHEV